MADRVQYRLERMTKELDDLERLGLFTHREIAEIVKQRRKFEYRLERPSPLKQDFLAYIEYETQLDSLRRLRKKAAARKANKKMKKSLSDYAGVSRIINIYQTAVTRYKGDIDLWLKYLEFCRQGKNGRMKKALAQVIRFHPKVPGVWIYAAAWEFDHNASVVPARALMQSGLRMCPKSEDLWVEYLRMELTYLNKLKARRVELGEDEGTLSRDRTEGEEKQWRDENQDLFMSLNDNRPGGEGSDAENEESKKKSDLFREQGLNVLRAIYAGALEALPSSLSLRKRFFEILESTDLADSEEMRKQMLSDLKRDFSADPEFWDWLARIDVPDLTEVKDLNEEHVKCKLLKAVEVYEEALEVAPLDEMFNLYIKFLMDAAFPEGEMQIAELSGCNEEFVSRLLAVYKKAETTGHLNEELACKYVSFFLLLERLDEARELAEKLCSGRLSSSAQLWQLRVSIEVKRATRNHFPPNKDDLSSIFELMKRVLTDISVSEAKSLWQMALDLFGNHQRYLKKLVEIAFISLLKNGGSEDGFSISSTMVKLVLDKDGIDSARKIYQKFLTLPRPSVDIYKTSIELELNLASSGDKKSLEKVRSLFEAALLTYDQNSSLWQDYYSMEMEMGTSETANAVHWRARKTLKDASGLTALRNC